MTNPAGTYALRIADILYIGSSSNLPSRKRAHAWQLHHNSHHCKRIQDAFNEFGHYEFTPITIIERSSTESPHEFQERLRTAEQNELDHHAGNPNLANLSTCARPGGAATAIKLKKLWQDQSSRNRILDKMRATIAKRSPETTAMIRAKIGANNSKSRAVCITHPDGSTSIFPCASAAARFLNVSQQSLALWLNKKSPWPGTGKNNVAKHRHIATLSAHYITTP